MQSSAYSHALRRRVCDEDLHLAVVVPSPLAQATSPSGESRAAGASVVSQGTSAAHAFARGLLLGPKPEETKKKVQVLSSSLVKGRLPTRLYLPCYAAQRTDAHYYARSTSSARPPRRALAIRPAARLNSCDRILPNCASRAFFSWNRSCRLARDQYAPPRSS